MAENKSFQHFVRIANTDLIGSRPIINALTKIQGIGPNMASAICTNATVDKKIKAGNLTKEQVQQIEKAIQELNIPVWMRNRPKDPETGEDKHIITTDLVFEVDNDIKMMKKIKSYKGLRHAWHLPVRGQRTKANFRRGSALGVVRSKAAK